VSEQHEPLALKYRPSKFTDISGQKGPRAVLYRMVGLRNLPPAMIFWGTRGTGKTTSARIVAAALNCQAEPGPADVWPCGSCPSCVAVAEGISPDVMEIDAASNGNVAEIRKIRESVLYGTGGEYRVVILDEAHSMSGSAFEALLKIIEEPPPNTLFILCTTELGKVIPTVRSRCMKFRFRPISEEVIRERLEWICQAESIPADPALLAGIAVAASGGMRDAIMQLDQVTSVGITSQEMWQELTGEDDYAPKLLAAAVRGEHGHGEMYQILDDALYTSGDYTGISRALIRCTRDLLVLVAGGRIQATGVALEARQNLARQLGTSRIYAAQKVLWDLMTKVRTDERREGLEIAMAMISEKLCPPADRGGVPVLAPAASPMGVDGLHAILG
jgi:DNA polymerase III subunit gamma/tau